MVSGNRENLPRAVQYDSLRLQTQNGHRSKTLSYIVPVYNMQQYQKAKGYIIINLFPDKFENLLQVLEPSYHQITWSQGGRTILTERFTKNAENNSNFIEQKYKETDPLRIRQKFFHLDY